MPIYTEQDFNQQDNWKIYDAVVNGGGGGGGSATAANQILQLAQTTDGLGDSVFKKASTDESWLQQIFNIVKTTSTDTTNIRNSVVNDQGSVVCTSFTAANPAALQLLVENYLNTAQIGCIMNISYTENGTSTQHTCYITINAVI